MAMPIQERRNLMDSAEENKTVRRERSASPARSRAATARKLAPVAEPTTEEITETRTKAEDTRLEQERLELVSSLELKRGELIERLDRGAACIEEARVQGKNVSDWEDYWIQLLRNYEKVCDQLAALTVN